MPHIIGNLGGFDGVADGDHSHVVMPGIFYWGRKIIQLSLASFGNHSAGSEDVEEKKTGKRTRAFISTRSEKREPWHMWSCILVLSW